MPDKSYKYTDNMKELVDGKISELGSYFCREDFELVLSEYDRAPEDARIFGNGSLKRICKARGIDVDELINDRSILETIQTRSEMQDELLTLFYNLYKKAPTTNDFMERIVRRLDPEYSSDPIRLVILKKFVAGGGSSFQRFKTGQIIELAKERFSPEESVLFDKASEEERQNMILSKIDDSIFEKKKIELTGKDILKLIVGRIEAYRGNEKYKLYKKDENGEDKEFEFNDIELSKDTQNALSEMLSAAGIEAEGTAFEMLKALDDCVLRGTISPAEKEFEDLIACIENDFKKQLRAIKRKKREGEKESLDKLYKDAKRDALRTDRMEILRLVMDCIAKYRDNEKLKLYKEDENGEDIEFKFNDIELSENTKKDLSEALLDAGIGAKGTAFEMLKALEGGVSSKKISPTEKKFKALIDCVENNFKKQLSEIKCEKRPDEALYELYRYAKRDALRAQQSVYAVDAKLLELCNDLAAGNFRPNGKTKVHLYYFAFMFDMKLPMKDRKCESERNFVKNLFEDYYNDNLLRLLSENYTDCKSAAALEKEPTGEGINYKNFAEAIYLYFLCHDDLDMTPGEKIDKAEEIIAKCVKRAAKEEAQQDLKNSKKYTQIYRDEFNILLNKNVDEIEDYILKNYRVLNSDNLSRVMVASEENTAADIVEEIMQALDEAYPDIDLLDFSQREDMPRTLDEDIDARLGSVKRILEERYPDDEEFLKLVNAIYERTYKKNERFNRNEKSRMLMILHILALYSSEDDTRSMYEITTRLENKQITSVASQRRDAIKALTNIGFDIQDNGNNYYLGRRKYDDKILNDILAAVSVHHYAVKAADESLITQALEQRLSFNMRITRSELITLHFNYYIARMDDTAGCFDTFPEVFENYAKDVNWYLEEARYQSLSVKNIFDMYIVIALYFYLFENRDFYAE